MLEEVFTEFHFDGVLEILATEVGDVDVRDETIFINRKIELETDQILDVVTFLWNIRVLDLLPLRLFLQILLILIPTVHLIMVSGELGHLLVDLRVLPRSDLSLQRTIVVTLEVDLIKTGGRVLVDLVSGPVEAELQDSLELGLVLLLCGEVPLVVDVGSPERVALELVTGLLVPSVELLGELVSFPGGPAGDPASLLRVLGLSQPLGVLLGEVFLSSLGCSGLLEVLSDTPFHALHTIVLEVIVFNFHFDGVLDEVRTRLGSDVKCTQCHL